MENMTERIELQMKTAGTHAIKYPDGNIVLYDANRYHMSKELGVCTIKNNVQEQIAVYPVYISNIVVEDKEEFNELVFEKGGNLCTMTIPHDEMLSPKIHKVAAKQGYTFTSKHAGELAEFLMDMYVRNYAQITKGVSK